MTEERINELIAKGFKRWSKGNYDRLYINARNLGLKLRFYNTGNIAEATFNGEEISNRSGGRLASAKTYIDIKTGEVYSDDQRLADAAKLLAGIE